MHRFGGLEQITHIRDDFAAQSAKLNPFLTKPQPFLLIDVRLP